MSDIICRALYPYNGLGGEKITTLDFEAGEVIKVHFSGDPGWWEGEVNGSRGWFPASYVEKIEEEAVDDCWEEAFTEDGEVYYVNTKTNETSWELPKSMEANQSEEISNDVTDHATLNNTNGNSLHIEVPSTIKPDIKRSSSQSSKSNALKDEVSPPQSEANPKNSLDAPVIHRSNTFSNPSKRLSVCSNNSNMDLLPPRMKLINGISFPDEIDANAQTLLQPGNFSYCDYFWGDTNENNNYQSGFFVLYQKLLKGKQMCKEMADLMKAREAIEIQYAKSLASLSASILASQEEGTLGEAWKQLKAATLLESKIHQDFAGKLRNEVMQNLLTEREKERKEMKKIEASINELRKQVNAKYQVAEKTRQQLIEKTKDFDMKDKSLKYTKEEVNRARRKSTKYAEELVHVVEQYNKQRQQWFEEMVTSTLILERHETERVENVKSIITTYSSLLRNTCIGSGETCDIISEQLKQISAEKDRETWVMRNTTGKIRPVDLII